MAVTQNVCDRQEREHSPLRVGMSVLAIAVLLFLGCDGDPQRSVRTISVPTLDGNLEYPFRDSAGRFIAFVFVRTDCPISNRYAPEVRRVYERFAAQGVDFVLVYTDPNEPMETVREHIVAYSYPFRGVRDTRHTLVDLAGATVTPEVALFTKNGHLLYRGRIDDRFPDYGKARHRPAHRDFEAALIAATSNQPIQTRITHAVGCFIPDLSLDLRDGESR
jgi:hypothetical protein